MNSVGMNGCGVIARAGAFVVLGVVALLLMSGCASRDAASAQRGAAATIERLEVLRRDVAYGGARFGEVGEYERIVAVAHVRMGTAHPANQRIVDLAAAADADGQVRYRTDVVILRPRDAGKASRVLVFDVANRGRKLMLQLLDDAELQTDSAAQAGNGWLLRQGHTLVWVGWQGDIALDGTGKNLGMALPIAHDRSGGSIAGRSVEEIVFDVPGNVGTLPLSYPAATLDPSRAELTVRARPDAPPTVLAPPEWRYTNASEIEIRRPAAFDAGAIYQFDYEARDPRPMGLGMAAVRDVVSFLKSADADAAGTPNPLADIAPRVSVAIGISQSGRLLRDFVWQGFNAAPGGGRVFDGVMPTIAGSRKTYTNVRWAQPGRYARQHEDHWFYGDQFPFGYATLTDPLTGRSDGIDARCRVDATCPKIIHLDSNLEYWQARASLVVTDGAGHDVALPDDVRVYLMSATQHVSAATPAAGICQLPNNPARQSSTYRALMTRLIAWARDGEAPPASRYPTVAAGTLVAPQRAAMGFPDLAALGLAPPTVWNELNPVDHTVFPPRVDRSRRYTVLVPRTDADGHDLAGIRVPDIEVPLATHTGFGLRKAGYAEGALCGLNGSYLPLAASAQERAAKHDPRLSIAERYPTRAAYVQKVRAAAERLRVDGLILDEDVTRLVEGAAREQRLQGLAE
ncbi:MAG TPA: alpha/beta hydrolase domain-containing protein [Burkholderiaceae bacterium]|nr:alpha/beta hydrolase domain-containing protein [Burkholderiaceae bacterium]